MVMLIRAGVYQLPLVQEMTGVLVSIFHTSAELGDGWPKTSSTTVCNVLRLIFISGHRARRTFSVCVRRQLCCFSSSPQQQRNKKYKCVESFKDSLEHMEQSGFRPSWEWSMLSKSRKSSLQNPIHYTPAPFRTAELFRLPKRSRLTPLGLPGHQYL